VYIISIDVNITRNKRNEKAKTDFTTMNKSRHDKVKQKHLCRILLTYKYKKKL